MDARDMIACIKRESSAIQRTSVHNAPSDFWLWANHCVAVSAPAPVVNVEICIFKIIHQCSRYGYYKLNHNQSIFYSVERLFITLKFGNRISRSS